MPSSYVTTTQSSKIPSGAMTLAKRFFDGSKEKSPGPCDYNNNLYHTIS